MRIRSRLDASDGVGNEQRAGADCAGDAVSRIDELDVKPAGLCGPDVVGVGEAQIGLAGRHRRHHTGIATWQHADLVVGQPHQKRFVVRGCDQARPIRLHRSKMAAGRAEPRIGHHDAAFERRVGQVHPRLGKLIFSHAIRGIDDHPRSRGKPVPPALRVTELAGPIGRGRGIIWFEHPFLSQLDRHEHFRRPEHIGLGVVGLGAKTPDEPGGLFLLNVANEIDANAGLLLELGDHLPDKVIVGRDIENDAPGIRRVLATRGQ